MKNDIFKLLEGITQDSESTFNINDRVLLIDGFNLFMRNFAMINHINNDGDHIGGLGGFLKSLGYLIKETQPTSVYIIFDGIGSSLNRKNLVPEYKSGRTRQKITNKNIFSSLDEESDAKVNQISRLIHYLRCLPVKLICIDRTEADDIIAYLAKKFQKVIIVSSDNDFYQLLSDSVSIFKPHEKYYFTNVNFKEKYGFNPENYIIYKVLVGDASDNIKGIKDLGPKTLLQKFPELLEQKLTLDDIFKISEDSYKKHIIYSRIIFEAQTLRNYYHIMDLENPLIDDKVKEEIELVINQKTILDKSNFLQLYAIDKLNHTITNLGGWLNEFSFLHNIQLK